MIVDDWKVIIGSANINDWSMLGTRDSEIACIIQDKWLLKTRMGDEEFMVGKFAHEFWKELFKEHYGTTNDEEILDPASKETWEKIY